MIANTQEKINNLFEVTREPANRYATAGQSVSFDVVVSGPGTITYQWQVKKASYGSRWTNIGTNSATLTITASSDYFNGQFRCVATNTTGQKVTSNIAILYEGSGQNTNNPNTISQKHQYYLDLIDSYEDTIYKIYNGTTESTGLYEAMRAAVDLVVDLDRQGKLLVGLQTQQDQIESAFSSALGD